MEQSLSWEAVSHFASQQIPRILWNQEVQYRVQISPSLVPILSHMHPAHNFPYYCPKIHPSINLPSIRLGLPSDSYLQVFQPKYWFLIPPRHSTRPAYLILLDLIILLIFGEACKLWSSNHFLPLTSKYFPQHPFHKHPQSMLLPQCERLSSTPIKNSR
jgi:hypothetical protein